MGFKVAAFVRRSGAPFMGIHFGHVGWAFQIDRDLFLCGSLENISGDPFRFGPGNTAAYWAAYSVSFGDMLGEMTSLNFANDLLHLSGDKRLPKYDEYKVFDVDHPNVNAAKKIADDTWKPGFLNMTYSLVGQNCLDLAYSILYEYGAFGPLGIVLAPKPSDFPAPGVWFNALDGQSHAL